MITRAPLCWLWLALCAASCQLGPGVPCSEDTACSPWGRCGIQGFCISHEDPGISDAGYLGANTPDAGR